MAQIITIKEVYERQLVIDKATEAEAIAEATEMYMSDEFEMGLEDLSLYTISTEDDASDYDEAIKIYADLAAQHQNRLKDCTDQKKLNRAINKLRAHIKEKELTEFQYQDLLSIVVHSLIGSEMLNNNILNKIAGGKIPSISIKIEKDRDNE